MTASHFYPVVWQMVTITEKLGFAYDSIILHPMNLVVLWPIVAPAWPKWNKELREGVPWTDCGTCPFGKYGLLQTGELVAGRSRCSSAFPAECEGPATVRTSSRSAFGQKKNQSNTHGMHSCLPLPAIDTSCRWHACLFLQTGGEEWN